MLKVTVKALLFSSLGLAVVAAGPNIRTIRKDVAIIGGGASGVYAAIKLKDDYGKSVVIVEREKRLGGHVSPYVHHTTGDYFDLGVQVFLDYGPARSFFARLNVTTAAPSSTRPANAYADFSTGTAVNFTARPFVPDVQAALQTFFDVVKPWESFYMPGYFNFPAPKDIPEDLLLPFGEFVRKHNLEGAVTNIFSSTGLGMGDLLGSTTLYVLGTFGGAMAEAMLGGNPMFGPASGRNIELYENAEVLLGKDVLYNSTVVQGTRSHRGVELLVRNTDGTRTRIIADKLLFSAEPTRENMHPFSLDEKEREVVDKFKYTNEYVALVSHPSLPEGTTIVNLPASAAPSNTLSLPQPDFLASFQYHHRGNTSAWRAVLVGDESFTPARARALVEADFNRLMRAGTIPKSDQKLEILDLAVHGAMHMHVSPRELRRGFIQKMNALQGRRSTWYTGKAWSAGFQSVVWAFDDVLLEKMFGAAA